jgi:hypothetical protein
MSSTPLEYEIELLLQIKLRLIAYHKFKEQEEKYTHNPVLKSSKHLLEQINCRLSHFCQHNIIQDIIEIGLDKTKTIYYCDKCDTTFTP